MIPLESFAKKSENAGTIRGYLSESGAALCTPPPVTDSSGWHTRCKPFGEKVFAAADFYDEWNAKNATAVTEFDAAASKLGMTTQQYTQLKKDNKTDAALESAAKNGGTDMTLLDTASARVIETAENKKLAADTVKEAVDGYNSFSDQGHSPNPQIPADLVTKSQESAAASVADAKQKAAETAGTKSNLLSTLGPLAAVAGLVGLGAMMMGGGDEGGDTAPAPGSNITDIPEAPETPTGTGGCGAGMVDQGGVCVVQDGSCEADQYPDASGTCISKPTCKEDETFNVDVRACIAKKDDDKDNPNTDQINVGNPDAIPGEATVASTGEDEEDPFASLAADEAALSGAAAGGSGTGAAGAGSGAGSGSGAAGNGGGRNFAGFAAGGGGAGYGGGAGRGGAGGGGEGRDATVQIQTLKWTNPVVRETLQESLQNK